MKLEDKFVIELNKELTVKHKETKCGKDEKELIDPKHFELMKFFLKFDDDLVVFEFQVKNHVWKEFSEVKKAISYEGMWMSSMKKFSLALPSIADVLSTDLNYTKTTIKGDTKNVLLNLFSLQKKEFKLVVNYKFGDKNYRTELVALVPDIDQKDWYASVARTELYKPETISFDLIKLFKNNFKLSQTSSQSEATLCTELLEYVNASTREKFQNFDYFMMLRRMMVIEDLSSSKMIEDYGLTFQTVFHFRNTRMNLRFQIESQLKILMCNRKMRTLLDATFVIEATKKMPADAMEFDHIYLTDMHDYQNFKDDLHEIAEHRITGRISYIFGNIILFKPVFKDRRELRANPKLAIDPDRPYHVEFVPNRIAFRVAHRAVEDAEKNQMSNYLRNFIAPVKRNRSAELFTKFQWMNRTINKNKQQQTAIKNIVNCTSFPSPYVIFGPPGTGKSTTIIEAIAQIIKLKPRAHILVTASSNSACDDIGNRLLDFVSVNKVLRLYSPSFDQKPERIDKKLEPISNFRNRYLCACKKRSCPELQPCDDPTYEEFHTARVIVATLVSCGRIVSSGIKQTHFDYIFIDEAASDSEAYTLIPISGLGASLNSINAQIVLSGDHKQLGAIVVDKFCRRMGMERSMMERMMYTNRNYGKRDQNYDSTYVTLLVQNYRSHSAILQFSNENFYDSMLVAKCPSEIANFACGSDLLFKNKDFPILFHTTRTPSQEVGTSLKNDGEINILSWYVEFLLKVGLGRGKEVYEEDIGIISPYRAQRDRLNEQFEELYPKVEIGTVDSFQGREKKIIILTTVRSNTRHVGFLRNEKRLNVAITRAKSLLIIIGNSSTLQKCVIWNKFIAYCHENRALAGDALSFDETTAKDKDNFKGAEEVPDDSDFEEDEYDN